MFIVLAIYAAFVWLIFFKLELFPWGRGSKTIVGLIGLSIILLVIGFLNYRTPSGRVTVMAPVVEIAPLVSGTVTSVPVQANTIVQEGDLLLELDRRPFEYALQLAQANFDIAEKTYHRQSTVYETNNATVSKQAVDEALSNMLAAEARLLQARYDLDQTVLRAPAVGEITAVRVSEGDRVAAMTGLMPLIRSDRVMIAGVFRQNGGEVIAKGAEVGLTLDRYPGRVFWTEIRELAKGSAGGQIAVDANLLGAGDIGSASELLVVVEWPDTLDRSSLRAGAVGTATVFAEDAGAIAVLANIMLWIKTYAAYL